MSCAQTLVHFRSRVWGEAEWRPRRAEERPEARVERGAEGETLGLDWTLQAEWGGGAGTSLV